MQDTGKNIIIAGVGGQGILLFSNLLSKFYMKLGYELKISDVIGLGQRGGGVESHFRYSNKPVLSPFIKAGDADYVISFEQTETLRYLHCLKEDGVILSSTFELSTSSVNTRLEKDMPESKTELIRKSGKKTFIVDPDENKNPDFDISKMMNIVMLGFYSEYRGYNHDEMIQIVKENVPEKFVEGNIKAYEKGWAIARAELVAKESEVSNC
ncbi:indolepyruvate oxidoreductase subunit beta [Alkalitalea saponilacus]|uniref:Indolepyruvate ferredoxin oxidoreductase beta subunit n=1 Tax=Alkalitalea saponilacus TaxID=889453 RepID=A0A1T5DKA3_9BACT|nr:indolepyruvate oxidoreductase subunit beta [Alkalitalea saponilacus]ASB50720.1 indolepyruvate oxidoreductase subunit beta [Alkalitalea saponilacus]SKB72168.1 indolepyruvate ferredoxin oxidoreductase beta subunit [Alkalitalea saponilacus]